ncbi:MAG: hypothetical protein J6J11_02785 [Treponema sp.]|nr:hypothetical protein [Treponema sp.]
MLTTILTAAFIFFAVIAILPGILKARKRCWVEAVSRIIITILSALLSAFITSLVSFAIGKMLVSLVASLLTSTSLNGILADVPSAENVVAVLIAFIIANILYLLLFIIIKAIALVLAAKPLTKLFLLIAGAIKKQDYISEVYGHNAEKHFSIPSAIFGAICGFVAYILILVPLAATLNTVGHTEDFIQTEGIFAEITDAASENVGTKTVMTLGGKPIYKLYTSFDVDGEKIDFEKEVKFIVEAYEGFEDMTDESLSPEESGASLRDISLYIDDTTVVPAILADLINAAGEDWIAGNEFHSIPCPDLGEGTHDIIISLLKCLSDSTSETMKEDLKSIINILAIVAENKNDDGSSMEISALLSNKALVSKISVEVLDNERLAPMIKHLMVSNVSGPAPTITIELPKEDDPQYNEFIDKVVTGYSDGIQAENTEKALDQKD